MEYVTQAASAMPDRIRQCAAEGQRVGIAVGAFGLIHAGTIRFLKQASNRCDRLFVAIVSGDVTPFSPDAAAQIARLLRPDERERILGMTDGVEAASLVDPQADLAAWVAAAPQAVWFLCQSEADLAAPVRDRLEALNVTVEMLPGDATCTTLDVLARLAR
jgi:glycerol-3-phosphate cytidylyltransferase-like family protein